jgi:hypothetical protein
MNWFKRNPVLGTVVVVLVLILVAEGWLLNRERVTALRAIAALEQKKQDRDWLARQSPALSEENSAAIAKDLATATQVLTDLRTVLQGRDARLLAAPPPAKSIDVFFDIAAFVEKTRALAVRSQVAIRPDERFGFASHANEGPETELVPAVYRQRILSQYLVEALIEAHPRALLSVQREHPLTAAQHAARNQPPQPGAPAPAPAAAPTGGQPADFFEFDPQLSVRSAGRVDGEAFRLEFTGQTPALRSFLNTLATFKLPLVVRSVDVQPVASDQPQADAAETPVVTGAPVPLVTQNLSKFAVVVEFVDGVGT